MKHGINVRTGTQISEILSENGKASGIRTAFGENRTIRYNPCISWGKTGRCSGRASRTCAGPKWGGIIVDDEMRTSHKDIWACGDCVQMKNRITGKPAYVPLGTTANKQGRIAGGNVAGGHDTFKGILGSMVTKVFELFIAATGLSQEQAAGEGYDAISVSITKADRAS